MDFSEIYQKILSAANEGAEWIKAIEREVYKTPETGFKEENTSKLVQKAFSELGMDFEFPLAVTGVKAILKVKSSKYNVCIIGERDSIFCAEHPDSAKNGAVHACGHSAQIGAMLGTAYMLKTSGVMEYLDGDVTFMAVPAEEFNELDFRKQLKKDGKINYFSGKQQLVYEGAFDNVDMAIMLHARGNEPKQRLYLRGRNLGFISKKVTFSGKAAHAASPADGTNALNAAALAILGIHSNRDTFREEERIRIHPIITKGGDVVNSVPDEVVMEMQVRGATLEAVKKADSVADRSIMGACQMIGAQAQIENTVGYIPLKENEGLSTVMEEFAKELIGNENIVSGYELVGSTDMGDLSAIMPAIQPSIGGFIGGLHSKEFEMVNADYAVLTPTKLMALTAAALLSNGAKKAEEIKNNFVPVFTKEQYLKYLEGK